MNIQPYQIISDSACDLPVYIREQYSVDIVSYYATFDTVNYHKEFVDITAEEFYEKVKETVKKEGKYPKTSLPPIQDYMDTFEPHLKAGKDILCICLTSKFSGSFQSANNAKQILSETYPDRRIEVIDSISVTGTQGMLVAEACEMQKEGKTLDEVLHILERQKQTSKIYFTVDSLDFLQQGGRVGKASALAGAILNIKPIIAMKEGELFPESKVRGYKKALKTILDMICTELTEKQNYRICVICAEKERQEAALELIETLKQQGFTVETKPWTIGMTIGTHCGPTAIGICYIQKHQTL